MAKTLKFADYEKGSELPDLNKGEITHLRLVRYAGASGDFNPIHHDNEFAKAAGLDGTIAHGMFVMGMLGEYVSGLATPKNVRSFKVAFKGMTLPGETVICKGKVKRKAEDEDGTKLLTVAVQAENEKGEIKVSGDAVIIAE